MIAKNNSRKRKCKPDLSISYSCDMQNDVRVMLVIYRIHFLGHLNDQGIHPAEVSCSIVVTIRRSAEQLLPTSVGGTWNSG